MHDAILGHSMRCTMPLAAKTACKKKMKNREIFSGGHGRMEPCVRFGGAAHGKSMALGVHRVDVSQAPIVIDVPSRNGGAATPAWHPERH